MKSKHLISNVKASLCSSLTGLLDEHPLLAFYFLGSVVFLLLYNFGPRCPNTPPGQPQGTLVLFSNDASFGMQQARFNQLPQALSGRWNDLNWLGGEEVTPSINLSVALGFWFAYAAAYLPISPILQFCIPTLGPLAVFYVYLFWGLPMDSWWPRSRLARWICYWFIGFFGSLFLGFWNQPRLP